MTRYFPELVEAFRANLPPRCVIDGEIVLVDASGNRLGMGGGFYDRSLEFLRHRHHWYKPQVLGLAYDFQRVNRLQPESWDIPLQGIITEQAVYL